MKSRLALFILAASAGCSSSGTATPEAASVPIYESSDDVPCEFEVMRVVRGESSATTGGSPAAYERERARVLSREGAQVGADAVIVVPVGDLVGRQRQATAAPGAMPTPTLTFEGRAIRFLSGTCADGR